ncbi:MAG: protein kinase [Planctomycetes bacterium]|nr:protein kinase [Planctomycetota bacterium]
MTDSSPALAPGQRLGEWVLEAPLGRGAYAQVWRARHNALTDRAAAVKVPHDPAWAARLHAEGALLQRVSGRHVVAVQGLDPEHDPPYLVMDLVEGRSLREVLAAGPLDPREAARITRDVAEGLRDAHAAGVVHRDLKPENILVDGAGRAYVADLGLGLVSAADARALLESGSLRSAAGHALVGTLRYMAPEQRDPEGEVDGRADLWALGVVLFEMLTGEAPGGAEVPSDVVPGLDGRLDRLYRHLCARQASRCPSAEHLLDDLAPLLADPAPPPPDPVAVGAARSTEIPAGVWWRGVAAALDALPFVALGAALRSPRALVLLVLAFVLADVVATTVFGRTPGRRLCRLRLVGAEGGPTDAAQRFQRQALRLVSVGLLGLGYLPALLSPGKRALHDLVSGTQVVHEV